MVLRATGRLGGFSATAVAARAVITPVAWDWPLPAARMVSPVRLLTAVTAQSLLPKGGTWLIQPRAQGTRRTRASDWVAMALLS